jgi:hypothetical protein
VANATPDLPQTGRVQYGSSSLAPDVELALGVYALSFGVLFFRRVPERDANVHQGLHARLHRFTAPKFSWILVLPAIDKAEDRRQIALIAAKKFLKLLHVIRVRQAQVRGQVVDLSLSSS